MDLQDDTLEKCKPLASMDSSPAVNGWVRPYLVQCQKRFLGEVKRASSDIFLTSVTGSVLLLKREMRFWSGINSRCIL